ncbi:MAG: hypothetical protein ABDK92_03255 [Atribacterota bacterium]
MWTREGTLFGPSSFPFRVRIVINDTDHSHPFLIQPPPFGMIEEVIPLNTTFSISFWFPLWRKDKITGNPNDGSLVYLGQVESQFQIVDFKKFARNLDPQVFKRTVDLNPPLFVASLEKSGKPIPEKRFDLLQEMLRFDFSREILAKLGQISQSIDFKVYLIQKARTGTALSLSEQKIQIWKYLENYPWYKLEPQAIGKIFQEDNQILSKITEYLKKEGAQDQTAKQLKAEIQEYFSRYIEKNPQSYSQELWEYSIEKGLSLTHTPSPDQIRTLTYIYVHDHLHTLEELLQSEEYQKTLTERYGVTLEKTKMVITEDLFSRHPDTLP